MMLICRGSFICTLHVLCIKEEGESQKQLTVKGKMFHFASFMINCLSMVLVF